MSLLIALLTVSSFQNKASKAQSSSSWSVQKPLGLSNTDRVCYANATLEALFHLDQFNERLLKIKNQVKKDSKLASLKSYLKALKSYRHASAQPTLFYFMQGYYRPTAQLSTYKGITNKRHEPTEIVQNILFDITETSIDADHLFNLLPAFNLKDMIKSQDAQATAHLMLKTSTSQYVFVMLNNPSSQKLYELADYYHYPDQPILPITININQSESYQLKSIVSSSRLTQAHDSKEDLKRQSPNHSTAYVKIRGQWFYMNDQEVIDVHESHIFQYLSGQPCIIDRGSSMVEQFAPGILIYERKNNFG